MKYFLLLTLFFSSAVPLYLEGDYLDNKNGMIGGEWHFNKDGSFTYHEENCEGGRNGKGNYFIKNDSIHFTFLTCDVPDTQLSMINVKNFDKAEGSWKFNFQLFDDKTSEEIPFAVIVAKDSTGKEIKGTFSDVDGKAGMNITDYKGKITLQINYIPYKTAEMKFNQPGNYSLIATLHSKAGPSYITAGTQWDYKILESTKDKMICQTLGVETAESGSRYVRIEFVKKK